MLSQVTGKKLLWFPFTKGRSIGSWKLQTGQLNLGGLQTNGACYSRVPKTIRTIRSGNQLPASLLDSFPCKLNTFRKRVKNVVTSKEFKWEVSVNKWSDVKCSDVGWTDVIYVKWFYLEVKWSEVKWVKVKFMWLKMLCTLRWLYTEGTWLNVSITVGYILCWVCFNLYCGGFV